MTSFVSKLYTLITVRGFNHLASLLSIEFVLNMGHLDAILTELLTVKVFYKMADTVFRFHAPSGF